MRKILLANFILAFICSSVHGTSVYYPPCPKGEDREFYPGGDKCVPIVQIVEKLKPKCLDDWEACLRICRYKNNPDCASQSDERCLKGNNAKACLYAAGRMTSEAGLSESFETVDFEKLQTKKVYMEKACALGEQTVCPKNIIAKVKADCEVRKTISHCLVYYKAEAMYGDPASAEQFFIAAFGETQKRCKEDPDICRFISPLKSRTTWYVACSRARSNHPRRETYCQMPAKESAGLDTNSDAMALILPKDFQSRGSWPKIQPDQWPFAEYPCGFDLQRFCRNTLPDQPSICLSNFRNQLLPECKAAMQDFFKKYDGAAAVNRKADVVVATLFTRDFGTCAGKSATGKFQLLRMYLNSDGENCVTNDMDPDLAAKAMKAIKIQPSIEGDWKFPAHSLQIEFVPKQRWKAGQEYIIKLETPIEYKTLLGGAWTTGAFSLEVHSEIVAQAGRFLEKDSSRYLRDQTSLKMPPVPLLPPKNRRVFPVQVALG